jgi:hypothetical protein
MTVPTGRIEHDLLLIEDPLATPRREVPAPHSKDTYRTHPAPRG